MGKKGPYNVTPIGSKRTKTLVAAEKARKNTVLQIGGVLVVLRIIDAIGDILIERSRNSQKKQGL